MLSPNTERLRRDAMRCATLGLVSIRHPTWAMAHVQNFLDRRSEHRYADFPPPVGSISPIDALSVVTGASAQTIGNVLKGVPQPALHRKSALYGNPIASSELASLLYVCCRLLKPETVLETGVATGYSTAVMLRALAENEMGMLLSIDLPHLHPKAPESVGAAVDPALYGRWELHLGPAERLIPTVAGGRSIDIFVQDAAHWVRGQLAEYRAGWRRLKDGGVLISDDVGPGFAMFAQEVGQQPLYLNQDPKPAPIGMLVKGKPLPAPR